jgi:hypothetical protein
MELEAVPHKDKAPAFVSQDGTNHPAQNGNGYWEWQRRSTPLAPRRKSRPAKM